MEDSTGIKFGIFLMLVAVLYAIYFYGTPW
jgi:hypothetical protein